MTANDQEIRVTSEPGLAPVHPGELLREDILPELGLSVTQLARELHVSRQTLHALLAGRKSVTPAMALRLGKFLGNGPGLWLRMQQAFDLHQAKRNFAAELNAIATYHPTV